MAVEPEVVIEFNKLLSEHVNALWEIAGGLIIVEILIIAHTLVAQKLPFRKSVVAWVLSLSVIASAASLVSGYFAESAALANFRDYAADKGAWVPSPVAEWLNLIQIGTLTLAFLIFVLVFAAYSRVLAEGLIKAGVKKE
jgi:hypothetical protein